MACAGPAIDIPNNVTDNTVIVQNPGDDYAGKVQNGELAPDFSLPDINGNMVTLSQLRGKKVVINLWWIRCHGCTEEMPFLQEFYEKYFDAIANQKYENPAKGFASYFLSFRSGARLEIMQMEGIDNRTTTSTTQHIGLAHFAISVGSEEYVDTLTATLRADGYSILDGPRRTGYGYYESVVLDPDGNRIEITA